MMPKTHREAIIDGLLEAYHAVPKNANADEVFKKRRLLSIIVANVIVVNSELKVFDDETKARRYKANLSLDEMHQAVESRVNMTIPKQRVSGLMEEMEKGLWLGKKRNYPAGGRSKTNA